MRKTLFTNALIRGYAAHMQTIHTARAAELAYRFAVSKQTDEQLVITGATERRAIVEELLTLMAAPEVAELLGLSLSRVGQIVGGVRK